MRVIGKPGGLILVSGLIFLFISACQSPRTGTAPTTQATASRATETSNVATKTPAAVPLPTATGAATPSKALTQTPMATPNTPESENQPAGITLPPGFVMTKYADVSRLTGMVFDEAGRLYVTAVDGTIQVLEDSDGDKQVDRSTLFAQNLVAPLGLALHPDSGDVYVTSIGRIDILRDTNGDIQADEHESFAQDLPYNTHWTNTPKFGPDGRLYVGVGSTCDACVEADPRSATLMVFDTESKEGEILASGLRNSYDLAFHPTTGALFATDNGRDDLGLTEPQEELNHILAGGDYGWPDCWDNNEQSGCAGAEAAVAFFPAHTSANSIIFYDDSIFPEGYRSDGETAVAYVTLFGNFTDATLETGIARVQIKPEEDSYAGEVDFLARWTGNPLALAVGPDGALFVGDHTAGVIYRLSYEP